MTRDQVLLDEAKARYAQSYGFDTDRDHYREDWHFVPRVRRPWWFWLAYAALMSGGFWICWRAFWGWPMQTGRWLERLAG